MAMHRQSSAYTPKGFKTTRIAVELLTPVSTTYHGVAQMTYPDAGKGDVIFVNWKSFGGTETVIDGVYSVIDTGYITCRYRPDIAAGCRLRRSDGAVYEIKGEPENIDMARRIIAFHVERVKGEGAAAAPTPTPTPKEAGEGGKSAGSAVTNDADAE